jgi:hypothetical protein
MGKDMEGQHFRKIEAQLSSLHEEIGHLSKKNPNAALNKFKLDLINKVLAEANALLMEEYMPFEGFEQFDEVEIPNNSDVVMVLAQYLQCLDRQSHDEKYFIKLAY